jgi:hypothetical protein
MPRRQSGKRSSKISGTCGDAGLVLLGRSVDAAVGGIHRASKTRIFYLWCPLLFVYDIFHARGGPNGFFADRPLW